MYLFIAGLLIIIIGWLIQFYKTVIKKDKNINSLFLFLYLIGVILLIIGNYLIKDVINCFLNLISAILPLLILINVIKK
ncbi:MAG: hypothetical protein CIT01_09585 [Methanobacterium sp. BRmetb2]|nr:MAG: hypothetical protein CIT01_09585 [Methanobacterium sp. BRmetb2]